MKNSILLLFLCWNQNQSVIKIDSKLDERYQNLQQGTYYYLNNIMYRNSNIDSIAQGTIINNSELQEFKKTQKDAENLLASLKESDFINLFKEEIQKEYKDYEIEKRALFSFKKIPVVGLKKKEILLQYLNTTHNDSRFHIEAIFSYVSLDWNKEHTHFTAQKGVFLKKLTVSINEEECTGTFFNVLLKEIQHKTKK